IMKGANGALLHFSTDDFLQLKEAGSVGIFGPKNWTGRPAPKIIGQENLMISFQIVTDYIRSRFEDREQRRIKSTGIPYINILHTLAASPVTFQTTEMIRGPQFCAETIHNGVGRWRFAGGSEGGKIPCSGNCWS